MGSVASLSVVSVVACGYNNEGYSISNNKKVDTPFIERVITGDKISEKQFGQE